MIFKKNRQNSDYQETYRYIHKWESNFSFLSFITIPMIHIGSPLYYSEVSDIVNNSNLLLEEGIPIKIDSEIGSYKSLAKKTGYLSQSAILNFDKDLPRINIDISKSDFENGLLHIPKNEMMRFKLAKYYFFITPKKKLIDIVTHSFAYNEADSIDLIDPHKHYSYKHSKSSLDILITNTRNIFIKENIQDIIDKNTKREFPYEISITFGDEHMPSIYEILGKNGFKWSLYKKVFVFRT